MGINFMQLFDIPAGVTTGNHLNQLNLQLPDRRQQVTNMNDNIKSFKVIE